MTPKELVAGSDLEALEIRPPKVMSLSGAGRRRVQDRVGRRKDYQEKRLDVGSLVPHFYDEATVFNRELLSGRVES